MCKYLAWKLQMTWATSQTNAGRSKISAEISKFSSLSVHLKRNKLRLSPTAWKLLRFCHKKCLCHKKLSAYAIKIKCLRNPLEFHKASAPEPSGTSQGICTGTLRNLTRCLHRNPPEPQQVSSPAPSGTSRGICTGTLRNLVRNLVLKLHRIAQELIWAQDPIAMFCCWVKTTGAREWGTYP